MTDTREDIHYGEITESLNDKLDRDLSNSIVPMDFIVATKSPTNEDPTWFRMYKSGWIEQGGICNISQDTATTITLSKEMKNTNYSIIITARKDGATQTGGDGNFTADPISTTQFYWRNGDDFSGKGYWVVKGFAKDSMTDEESGETVYGNTYKIYKGVYPDWANGQTLLNNVIPTSSNPAQTIAPNDGFIRIYGSRDPSGYTISLTINDVEVGRYPAFASSFANGLFQVFKNDVIKVTTDATSEAWHCNIYYYPPKDVDAEMNLADDSEVVHLEGDETITGIKTFTGSENNEYRTVIDIQNLQSTADTVPSSSDDHNGKNISFIDKNGVSEGYLEFFHYYNANNPNAPLNGSRYIAMNVCENGETKSNIKIGIDKDGEVFTSAPTPTSETDNSTKIATTAHLMNVLKAIYPVGSIYIGTQETCPMSAFFGTWELVGTKFLTEISGSGTIPVKGNGKGLGFMDGQGNTAAMRANLTYGASFAQGSYGANIGSSPSGSQFSNYVVGLTTDASKSGVVADISNGLTKSTITANIWKRTA